MESSITNHAELERIPSNYPADDGELRDLQQYGFEEGTDLSSLFDVDLNSLGRRLIFDSLRDPEVRHELIWSGPISVISSLSWLIQVVVLVRLLHLLLDLTYMSSSKWKSLTNCLAGLYLIHTHALGVTTNNPNETDDGNSIIMFTHSVIIFYLTTYLITRYSTPRKVISISTSCDSQRTKASDKPGLLYLGSLLVVSMPILLNEYLIYHRNEYSHMALRSILMTIAMKVFSQIHSNCTGHGNAETLDTLGYILHPATCLFGPWHSISTISKPAKKPDATTKGNCNGGNKSRRDIISKFARQSIKAIYIFAQTLVILMLSASLLDLLETLINLELSSRSDSNRLAGWLNQICSVFMAAQKFRFSHYFMCYLAYGLMTLWHDPSGTNQACLSSSSSSSSAKTTTSTTINRLKTPPSPQRLHTCLITRVEWPRSLLEVVRCWNLPMSQWLKEHIFVPIRTVSNDNNCSAVLVTFVMSSLLHGFKFNIWSVLLSLGILTLMEHDIRQKLAKKLDACVLARNCDLDVDTKTCRNGHKRTERNSWLVLVINLYFRLAAMAHLAYLGYIFRGNTDMNTYKDDIWAWSELYFYSPLLATITFLLGVTLL